MSSLQPLEPSTPPRRAVPIQGRILGIVLGLVALALGLGLAFRGLASTEGPLGLLAQTGAFLGDSFAWAAWYLPLWLLGMAIVAFLPGYRPALLFFLTATVVPFFILALYARMTSEPSYWFGLLPGLESFGLPALGVVTGLLVLFLGLVAARLSLVLFPLEGPSVEDSAEPAFREARPPRLLMAPPSEAEARAARRAAALRTSRGPSSRDRSVDLDEDFTFTVPDLPPPPKLRSLGEEEPLDEEPIRLSLRGGGQGEGQRPEPLVPIAPDLPPLPPAHPTPPSTPRAQVLREGGSQDPTGQDPTGHELPGREQDSPESPSPGPAGQVAPLGAAIALAPAGSAEAASGLVASGPALGARIIEVVSVKPGEGGSQAHAAAEPVDPADEAEALRVAAAARILARKKSLAYAVPVDGLLNTYPDGQYWIVDEKTRKSAEVLQETLAEFNIKAEVTGIRKGPVITMFEILPAPGVRLSKIANLADNIALRLAASSVRIVAPIPGKHAVGIEVPNERRSIVSLREIVENEAFRTAKMEIPVVLGKDIAGEAQFIDLVQTPHLLIAGATGSGKSVCVNSIILSVLFRRSPEEVRLILIDPKIVELKLYNDVPHLLTPVITEPKRAFQALQYCICEMERRYSLLDRLGVRDIKSYNRKIKEKALTQERLPYIVVIIDEFADLMATTGKELESTLARLAAMSRAVGIHLVLATQRPSIDVITGLIKANIPSRIAFMVASKFDSRIIIDMVGAEKLLGRGDMLFASAWDPFPIRMQGAFVSEEEVEKSVEFVKTLGEPEYIDEEIFIDDEDEDEGPSLFDDGEGDPLFEQALEIVLQQGKASASYIQRKLKIGYNRAARLVELMEERGIVGKAQGSKPRDLVRNPEVLGRAPTAPAHRTEAELRGGLLPGLETVPGQRVTGRDEPEEGFDGDEA